MNVNLKVFTLNCWAIGYVPFMAQDRPDRVKAIARFLAAKDYDIVCLQELWTEHDRELIKEACREVLPHSAVFLGGVIGSGTMILTKWPILETRFRKFTLNGFKHHVWYGDALAGSGVGMAKLMIGHSESHLIVNAYVSHFHAEYHRENDAYKADRLVQAIEAGDFVQLTSHGADAIIYCGDFNTEPGDLPYKVLTLQYKLRDAQEKLKGAYLATCYAKENSYRDCDGEPNPREKTIDYVFFKSFLKMKVASVSRPLLHCKVEATGKSYSDHEALQVDLELARNQQENGLNGQVTSHEGPDYGKQVVQLHQEIRNALEEEVQSTAFWSRLHWCGLCLAFLVAFKTCSLQLALALFMLHLIMLSVYLERRCGLKAIIQDFFSSLARGARPFKDMNHD